MLLCAFGVLSSPLISAAGGGLSGPIHTHARGVESPPRSVRVGTPHTAVPWSAVPVGGAGVYSLFVPRRPRGRYDNCRGGTTLFLYYKHFKNCYIDSCSFTARATRGGEPTPRSRAAGAAPHPHCDRMRRGSETARSLGTAPDAVSCPLETCLYYVHVNTKFSAAAASAADEATATEHTLSSFPPRPINRAPEVWNLHSLLLLLLLVCRGLLRNALHSPWAWGMRGRLSASPRARP